MKFIFCADDTTEDKIIRFFDGGIYNHVGIVVEGTPLGDRVYESVIGVGVRNRQLASFKTDHARWEIVEVPSTTDASGLVFLDSQIGAPYDTLALWLRMLHISYSTPGKWYCVNYATNYAVKASSMLSLPELNIGVNDLYQLAKAHEVSDVVGSAPGA